MRSARQRGRLTRARIARKAEDEVDPRILKTRNLLLTATIELLADLGFELITVERISEYSGVARSTIYRHWPDAKDLLIEAFESMHHVPAIPDSGDIRTDLIEYGLALAAVLNDPIRGAVIGSLIAASLRDARLAAAHAQYTQRRRRHTRKLLQDAQARGQLPKDLDFDHVVTSLVAPMFYCRFILEQIVDRPFVERVIDGVLTQTFASRKSPMRTR